MNFLIYAALFIFFISFLSNEIYKIAPNPFMDEIFHIRQAREYFLGNYDKWDPMITTPPGLYILSVVSLKILKLRDNVTNLRLINLFFGIGILLVSREICKQTTFSNERALLIASLPNLFIFYGLYYTDAGSVLFVLSAYLSLIRKRRLMFLIFSLLSLTFRQTNIIWVAGFCIADRICKEVNGDVQVLWKRKMIYTIDVGLMIILCMLFSLFVYLNGGSIVLGDKESHVASLHFAQFLYCTTTIFTFCWPILIHKQLYKSINRIMMVFALALPISFLAIHYGTIVHQYLLADNRHWTNFIWRRFLQFKSIRYALIPIHSISIALLFENLFHFGILWVLGYFMTCAVVLIPSPLIEPRYYILPAVFFLLNCKITSKYQLKVQFFIFILINAFIIGNFLYKPFVWPHVPETLQRRIW